MYIYLLKYALALYIYTQQLYMNLFHTNTQYLLYRHYGYFCSPPLLNFIKLNVNYSADSIIND